MRLVPCSLGPVSIVHFLIKLARDNLITIFVNCVNKYNFAGYTNGSIIDVPYGYNSIGFKVNGIFERDDLTGFNWSTVPVILVEMGFMSNYNEDQMLSDPTYQKLLMRCVVESIDKYSEEVLKS